MEDRLVPSPSQDEIETAGGPVWSAGRHRHSLLKSGYHGTKNRNLFFF